MKRKLNTDRFIDLLLGTSFWTMAIYMAIKIRPISFPLMVFIILYASIGSVFIFKHYADSRR